MPGHSNNEITLVLQYYDYSVERTIQAYLEGEAIRPETLAPLCLSEVAGQKRLEVNIFRWLQTREVAQKKSRRVKIYPHLPLLSDGAKEALQEWHFPGNKVSTTFTAVQPHCKSTKVSPNANVGNI